MKFFITGATGFVGSHLCQKLSEEGHELTVLLRSPGKRALLPQDNITILKGNLSSFKAKDFDIPACDMVIHLAANINAKTEAQYFKDNFEAVEDLVECLSRQDWTPKRIIFASTIAAAGQATVDQPLTEAMKSEPIEPYGASKKMAEDFLINNSVPTTIFRPPLIFGPDDPKKFRLFKAAKKGIGFKIAGNDQQLSFIYVEDLVDAIVKMTTDESQDNKLYYLAYKDFTTISTIWKTLGRNVGSDVRILPLPKALLYTGVLINNALLKLTGSSLNFDHGKYAQMTCKAFTCSSDEFQKDFQWEPKNDLETTIKKTAESYRESGWLE